MIAYRIADRRYPLFDGTGAMLRGGRWNSPGAPVIYAAQTYAGAVLEVLVHANLSSIPRTQSSIVISIPDDLACETITPADLPGWNSSDLVASRTFGDHWLKQRRTAVLLAPSVVLQGRESNVLINPHHPGFSRLRATPPEPVLWDTRLFATRPPS